MVIINDGHRSFWSREKLNLYVIRGAKKNHQKKWEG